MNCRAEFVKFHTICQIYSWGVASFTYYCYAFVSVRSISNTAVSGSSFGVS